MVSPPATVKTLYVTRQRRSILRTLYISKYPLCARLVACSAGVPYETAYWSLRRLNQWGWVSTEKEARLPQTGGVTRRLYRLTSTGRTNVAEILDLTD